MKKKEALDFKRQLIEAKRSFKVTSTKYSDRITIGKKHIMFSDNPLSGNELKLINLVRADAGNFEGYVCSKTSGEIDFYGFYDTIKGNKVKGYKMDLNAAYWETAKNMGLLSERTCKFFEEKGHNFNKRSRLVALGSLATKQLIKEYEDGILVNERLVAAEQNRQIYLTICDVVRETMCHLAMEFSGYVIYYYWDCIFLKEGVDIERVCKVCKQLGYDVKVEGGGEFEIFKGKDYSYLEHKESGIKYPVDNGSL